MKPWISSIFLLLLTATCVFGQPYVRRVSTVADLVATNPNSAPSYQQIWIVEGRTSKGDGGGGVFYYDSASTTTTNEFSVYKPTSYAGRYINLNRGWPFNWFGTATNYTAKISDSAIEVTVTRTITLPTAASVGPGKFLYIKSAGAAVTTTVARSGSDTINRAASNGTVSPDSATGYWSDGVSNWESFVVGGGSVSGTQNQITKFATSSTLGDALAADNGSQLAFNSALVWKRNAKSGNYTIATNDFYVPFTASATATLPAANSVPAGFVVTIKSVGGSVTTTVARSGSDTIDGESVNDSLTGHASIAYVSDGVSNWEKN